MSDERRDTQSPPPDDRAAEWGRAAGRWFRRAGPKAKELLDQSGPRLQKASEDARHLLDENRPRLEEAGQNARRMLEENRPLIEKAGQNAMQYAHEHEDEIRAAAIRAARMRVGGPLGFVVDSLGRSMAPGAQGTAPQPAASASPGLCTTCQTQNAGSARFCSQCGTRLSTT